MQIHIQLPAEGNHNINNLLWPATHIVISMECILVVPTYNKCGILSHHTLLKPTVPMSIAAATTASVYQMVLSVIHSYLAVNFHITLP